jgi:transcription initiation factor TFIIE subunit alpha
VVVLQFFGARELKMSNKIIEEVASRVAGEDVKPLVRALKNRRDVSEFTLATETKTEINLVRNRLYRLYNANLVTSIKKKDKKKGWYIYYWTLNIPRFQYLAKDLIKQRIDQLKERLEREKSSNFFICTHQCIRLNFEQATDFEFKCPECGELLQQDDNARKITEIEKEIKTLEKELRKKLPEIKEPKPKKEKPTKEKTKKKSAKKAIKKKTAKTSKKAKSKKTTKKTPKSLKKTAKKRPKKKK